MAELDKSPLERLTALEDAVRLIVNTVSKQAGELQAVQAGFQGLLLVVGADANIRGAIEQHLERCAAMNLGASTNQPMVDSFTDAANLIRLAMDDHKERLAGDRGNAAGR